MKILLAGDTHGNIVHCQYLIRTALAKECDSVFILGDFGYWEHQKAGVKFLDRLNEYASALGMLVYFLDGNHDKTSLLMEKYGDLRNEEGFVIVRPNVLYAPRGHRWTWDHGVRFIALGGAYSVDKDWRLQEEELHPGKYGGPETLWFPEEEMSDEDMDRFLEDRTSVDVMLAHDKPRSSNPRWNRKDFLECLPNQDRLQRAMRALTPKAFFHGHLHFFYTDEVWYGHDGITRDMATTKVMGLLCNPEAGDSTYVNKTLSWQVFDTAAAWWR
jgi:predicted phosphodiesterase